jgi:RNA polymerase sigma factor (sigma-70 family)
MHEQPMDILQQDADAVTAVLRGDAERYRELVDRYKSHVFAVTWSRLGDVGLAEEAAQETFIRGYRRLWLLADGGRFPGWIASIARNAAINLGLRQRRELNKRERWALHNIPGSGSPIEDLDDPLHPASLRKALAELPDAHRECLVLFYIEGKTGAEAATGLGISESAFRVRLHRARGALREKIETSLAESLRALKPSSTITPSVMALVLTPSTAKTAGTGIGALLGLVAKGFPVAWFSTIFSAFMVLPIPFFAWFARKSELQNFREPAGFRSRLFRQTREWQPLWIVLMMALIWFFPSLIRNMIELGGYQMVRCFYVFLAVFFLVTFLILTRRLAIIRNRFFLMEVVSAAVMAVGCLAIGLRIIPQSLIFLFISVQALLASYGFGKRPNRMDYNLFLRAAERLFGKVEGGLGLQPSGSGPTFSKCELLTFARFLGSRWLAIDFRWNKGRLVLRLPPVKASLWSLVEFYSGWSQASQIILNGNGRISAKLSERDHSALGAIHKERILAKADLEDAVSSSLQSAWACLRNHDLKGAGRFIGETREDEIFVVPLAKSGLTRWRWGAAVVTAVLFAPILILSNCKSAWLNGLRPVNATESEIRSALAQYESSRSQSNSLSKGLLYAINTSLVLPSVDLFTSETLNSIRRDTFQFCGLSAENSLESQCYGLSSGWMVWPGLEAGWFRLEDLGLNRNQVSQFFHSPDHRFKFQLLRHQCDGPEGTYNIEQLNNTLLPQLRGLRDLNLLDLVDRRAVVQQLRSLQVLSGEASGGRFPLNNWRDLKGLFYLPGRPVIQYTYFDVAALEILGGLDLIDREACIKAVLRLHRGKGYFAPPDTDEPWKLQISGDAQDTLCAFELLRILAALDRVKDLSEWRFRPRHASNPTATPREITWDEIEAWVCQKRLDWYVRQRANKSEKAAPSLVDYSVPVGVRGTE